MRYRPLLVLGLIFLAGLIIGLVLATGGPDGEQPVQEPVPEPAQGPVLESADIVAQDIELVQGKQGKVLWRLRAASAEYDQKKGVVLVRGPQMSSYVGEDRREVYVRGRMGEVNQKDNNLTLWDDVQGRFGLFVLKADTFDYIGAMDKIFLKGGVSVSRPDISVNATAIEIDISARELVAAGQVTARITPEDFLGDLDAGPRTGPGEAGASASNLQSGPR
ncbi:MAG: LPS export ABC transporter periplasmic protein LptC [Desulfovibrionaceae bacterium]|nr:LPS export ABC transporter periplasmic protein LptC [Desulfovibrionaceae bacterium]